MGAYLARAPGGGGGGGGRGVGGGLGGVPAGGPGALKRPLGAFGGPFFSRDIPTGSHLGSI